MALLGAPYTYEISSLRVNLPWYRISYLYFWIGH